MICDTHTYAIYSYRCASGCRFSNSSKRQRAFYEISLECGPTDSDFVDTLQHILFVWFYILPVSLKRTVILFWFCIHTAFFSLLQQNGEAPLINHRVLVVFNVWHRVCIIHIYILHFSPRDARWIWYVLCICSAIHSFIHVSLNCIWSSMLHWIFQHINTTHSSRPSKRWKKKIKSSSEVECNVDKPKPKSKPRLTQITHKMKMNNKSYDCDERV